MNKLRVLIVDDEPLARRRIRSLLDQRSDVEVVKECGGGKQAVATMGAQHVDVLFLDIRMPDMNGFQVIEAVGIEAMPVVVFVTALDDQALRAFDVHAIDYLLKPFEDERFMAALDRAKLVVTQTDGRQLREQLQHLLETTASPPLQKSISQRTRLAVRNGNRTSFVHPDEIHWIQAEGSYVRLHTDQQSFLLRETMNRIGRSLAGDHFQRIHRSCIVNLLRIKEIRHQEDGQTVVLENGTHLRVSARYWPILQKRLELQRPS